MLLNIQILLNFGNRLLFWIWWTRLRWTCLIKNSHTTDYKIKDNIYTCFTTKNYKGERKTGEYEESYAYISVKGNLKRHLSFWKNKIRANETVFEILINDYKLHPFYTPSNAEFKKNSTDLENSEFVDVSIKKMLRTGTVIVSTKGKKR